MRAASIGLALLAFCQTWVWIESLRAQPADAGAVPRSDRAAEKSGSSEPVRRVEPDILFVKDAQGEMIPLLNHTLEEIEKLLEQRAGAVGAARPAFRLDRMVVSGEAGPKNASLTIQLTIFASDKAWVRVPLRLGSVALEKAEHQGEGEQFLTFDDVNREYVSWFRGETEKPHLLTLHGLVPLEQLSGQTRLKLNAPRAAHSELTLKTSSVQAVGDVSVGAVLAETRQPPNGAEFKVYGLTSDFGLSWRATAQRPAEAPFTLEATDSRILVQIDPHSVSTTASLTVRAFGREFDAFRVRLPPGATLAPAEHKDYSVVAVNAAPDGATAPLDGQWVEVRRKIKSPDPLEVRLATRRLHEETAPDQPLELAGFEVQGAARQWGYLAVVADNDWQVSFGKRLNLRQVEDLPDEQLLKDVRSDDLVASFEYYRQPFSLPVEIAPRETVVSVEPKYDVRVTANRLQLEARLAYRIAGAKAFSLEIDPRGWNVDVNSIGTLNSIGPPDLVDASRIVSEPGKPLIIPLKPAAFGRVTLQLQAQREIAADAKAIDFQLPRPTADAISSAELAITTAENVDLTPHEAEIVGLGRQQNGSENPVPAQQDDALFYRGDAVEARFAAGFRVNPRRVSVAASGIVKLDETGADVNQTFSYRIAYEPAETLLLEISRSLADAARPEVRLDEKPLPLEPLNEQGAGPEAESDAGQTARFRAKLPKPQIGDCKLEISYRWNGKPLIREASVLLKLPLVMPAEVECSENRLELFVAPGIKAEPLGAEWTVDAGLASSVANGVALRMSASRPWPEISLNVSLADRPSDETLIVERAWLQTVLAKNRRTDLAVYRFETRDHSFNLTLPQGSLGSEFWLDRERIAPSQGQSPDERIISWRDTTSEIRPHVLEIRYGFPDRGSRGGPLSIELPKLGGGVARRTYWQLVLPRDEFLMAGPAAMTPEASWSWDRFCWVRRPLLGQRDLEDWIFAGRDPQRGEPAPSYAPLSPAANQYLFSSIEIDGPLEVRTASRSMLVLIGSGIVLLAGLLLIYVPALRHPALLLAAGLAVLAGALTYPEVTLLWLQAAAVGALLTLVAGILERNVSRRRRREVLIRGGSSSIVNRSSTRALPRPTAAPAPVSTETAAVAVELAAPDSRP